MGKPGKTARMVSTTGPGAVRIIAGAWRGRSIAVPPGETTRPTAERVREALFNRLAHAFSDEGFKLPGARVVDVFAGTGALGLEALSRGASHAIFVDSDPMALDIIRRNVSKLGAGDRATLMNADGAHLPRAALAAELAFVDPPYGEALAEQALRGLAFQGWLKPEALVAVETAAAEHLPAVSGFTVLDRRAYGRTGITILRFMP